MTDYPVPAILSVALANLLAAIVFGALHVRERSPGMSWFAVAWTLEAVRHLFSLAEFSPITFFAGGFTFVAALGVLLEAAFRVGGRPPNPWLRLPLLCVACWMVFLFVYQDVPFLWWHLPVTAVTAVIRGLVAWALWNAFASGLGRVMAASAMGLWALHGLTYPLLGDVEAAKQWGYALSTFLGLLVPSGVLMAYFERAREEAGALERALAEGHRLEALGRLAGGIAHDFNNLLQVVAGALEVAQRERTPPDRKDRYLKLALDATTRGADLTRQLLAFGQRHAWQPRALDLSRVIGEVGEWLPRLLGDHVTLELRAERQLPVFADRGQIEQVVLNLVTNARDAMPEGGTVEVSAEARGRVVVLSVHDQGVGMSEETRARIFEPFFTTKERGKGTGLGLASVHGIAAQQGWELRVESAPGAGTTFEVRMPLIEDEPVSAEYELPNIDASAARILLVDDDPQVRNVLAAMLEDVGYDVTPAGPETALAVVEGGDWDVLVTDQQMPGLSGVELARAARQLRSDALIVFVSGDDASSEEPDIHRVGKPCRASELVTAIEHVRTREA
ncbi:MAG: response regulator [Sandaracinaceae bacterium]|nr:MAG: response regulator [Sandaracinaceae bacterium]